MLGDSVEVEIQKVDALRHQIDLAVVLPEGYEASLDHEEHGSGSGAEERDDDNDGDLSDHATTDA